MFPLPYDHFFIDTHQPRQTVAERLREILRPQPPADDSGKSYGQTESRALKGEVTYEKFRLRRVVGERNDFGPVIEGRLSDRDIGGTRVEVLIRLPWSSLAFMVFWLSIVGYKAGPSIKGLIDTGKVDGNGLFLLGFFLFGLILPTAGFWREARRARRYLEGLLQGDGAPPPIR